MRPTEPDITAQNGIDANAGRGKIRVAVADNQPIVVEGLGKILASQTEMEVVGKAMSVDQLLHLLGGGKVDVVIVEVLMAGAFALDFVRDIRSIAPDTRIIVLSSLPEDFLATRLFVAGINGYIRKRCGINEILRAIRKVAQGGTYASEHHLDALTAVVQNPDAMLPHHLLSDREFQVLQMVCNGLSTKQIAAQLSISVKTVSTHKARILQKMKMNSAGELIRYAVAREYLE